MAERVDLPEDKIADAMKANVTPREYGCTYRRRRGQQHDRLPGWRLIQYPQGTRHRIAQGGRLARITEAAHRQGAEGGAEHSSE